jgi:guanylate kinase
MAISSGRLVIISGPSGAGKSTVVQRLLMNCPLPLILSVSATTRPPRPGETHGREYWFLSPEEFSDRRKKGEFLESKEVFGRGYWYGTLAETVSSGLKSGKWVILEIDVHGAATVLEVHPDAITVFLHPGSLEELERRLRRRGTESEANIARRLEVAAEEISFIGRYRHEVVNREVDQAVAELCALLRSYDIG